MKRGIFVLFVLCSCISFLVRRTLAQEDDFKVGDNIEGIPSVTSDEEQRVLTEPQNKIDVLGAIENLNIPGTQSLATEINVTGVLSDGSAIIDSSDAQNEMRSEVNPQEVAWTVNSQGKAKAPEVNNIETATLRDNENEVKTQNGTDMLDLDIEVTLAEVESPKDVPATPVPDQKSEDTEEGETSITNVPLEVTTIRLDVTPTEVPSTGVDDTENTTTQTTNPTDTPLCTTTGTFTHANDCRSFIICSTAAATNELEKSTQSCPTEQAFQPELLRCTRDLSPCADAYECSAAGTFPDPHDNSSYFWCVPTLLNATSERSYHIYHVKCGNGQIYTPELGKCFVDMLNLQDLPLNYELYMSKSPDEECVREEVKILQAEEKVKLKEAKLREKIRKKYEKELRKKAAKEAKAQAKLQGVSLDGDTFNCVQEGNFAAKAESFFDYFVCLDEKGKFKAVGLKCAQGQGFSVASGTCTI